MTTSIPAAALKQHVIALGKTGSGKSSKLRLQVEYLLDRHMPLTIVDPKGDWWGLKSSADGKSAGYPLVIFGGDHADVPINEHSGAHVAELVATGNRPALIDLGGWMVGERTRFFVSFAATLFKLSRGERHLVLPECHNFAPQGKILDPDAGKMLHWANRLASEGRGRGITILADSQRPQKVHKDFLTCCETLIACKVIHKLDRDAIKDWIDGCADAAKGREVIAGLAQLKKPEAWVWSPEIDFGPQLVKFPMFRTFDSFRPRTNEEHMPTGWADVDLEDVKAKLATVVAVAKDNDPKALKARIAELEKQDRPGASGAYTSAHVIEARDNGEKAGFLRAARRFKEQIEGVLAAVGQTAATISGTLDRLQGELDKIETDWALPTMSIHPQGERSPETQRALEQLGGAVARNLNDLPSVGSLQVGQRIVFDGKPATVIASSSIGGAPRRLLIALAQNPGGLTYRKMGILADVSPGGSTWRGAMAGFRKAGHIEETGTGAKITAAGLRELGKYDPLPTGAALREYWQSKIGNSTRGQIFKIILNGRGLAVPAHIVARESNVELGGSTWRGHMAYLRGLELVSGSTELRAAAELFE